MLKRVLILILLFVFSSSAFASPNEHESSLDEEVQKKLDVFLKNTESFPLRKIATFDWDNTSMFNDVGEAMLDWMARNFKFSFSKEFFELFSESEKARLNVLLDLNAKNKNAEQFRYFIHKTYNEKCEKEGETICFAWLAKLYVGLSTKDVKKMAKQMLAEELKSDLKTDQLFSNKAKTIFFKRGLRYPQAIRKLIEQLNKNGFEVWVVSASFQPVVEVAAEGFGIKSQKVIGVLSGLDQKGHYNTNVKRLTYRQGKVDAIREVIRSEVLFAAGDSNTDIEMLQNASGGVMVIDRKKEPLMSLAKQKNWWIQKPFF